MHSLIADAKNTGSMIKVRNFQALIDVNYSHNSDKGAQSQYEGSSMGGFDCMSVNSEPAGGMGSSSSDSRPTTVVINRQGSQASNGSGLVVNRTIVGAIFNIERVVANRLKVNTPKGPHLQKTLTSNLCTEEIKSDNGLADKNMWL